MAQPQVIQGTWEEIAAHAEEFKERDDLLLIVPARRGEQRNGTTQNLAEALKDYIGSSNYGDANLSEDTSRKFAALLAEKHRKEQE